MTNEQQSVIIKPTQKAILFTDIQGFTRWKADPRRGDKKAASILSKLDEIFKKVVEGHKGKIVKTMGDGVMCAFDLLEQGIRSAVEIQQQMNDFNDKCDSVDDRIPKIRMGVGVGSVDYWERLGFQDYVGLTVDRISRIERLAEGGHIFVAKSDVVGILHRITDLLNKGEIKIYEHGEKELRGVGSAHVSEILYRPFAGIGEPIAPQTRIELSEVHRLEELMKKTSEFFRELIEEFRMGPSRYGLLRKTRIREIEKRVRKEVWVHSSSIEFDRTELKDLIRENLKRGVSYTYILPYDDNAMSMFEEMLKAWHAKGIDICNLIKKGHLRVKMLRRPCIFVAIILYDVHPTIEEGISKVIVMLPTSSEFPKQKFPYGFVLEDRNSIQLLRAKLERLWKFDCDACTVSTQVVGGKLKVTFSPRS